MNTLLLRLEGPLQSWGETSKFVIRRTKEAPTKSGVIGMILAALGVTQKESETWLEKLNKLQMGVRIDKVGTRIMDYHTVGAGYKLPTADGKTSDMTLLTLREYLCDASFLVALQGDSILIDSLREAIKKPVWPLWLGRKCCVPSQRILESSDTYDYPDIETALASIPCIQKEVTCLLEWIPSDMDAPDDSEVWCDVPLTMDPYSYDARLVTRKTVKPVDRKQIPSYQKKQYKEQQDTPDSIKVARRKHDNGLCVFCKSPAQHIHHITYARKGREELQDLRSLCKRCHDAITFLEYRDGDVRIDPCDVNWRDRINFTRREIA